MSHEKIEAEKQKASFSLQKNFPNLTFRFVGRAEGTGSHCFRDEFCQLYFVEPTGVISTKVRDNTQFVYLTRSI